MNIGNLDNPVTKIDQFWEDDPQNLGKIEPICLVMNIAPEKVIGLLKLDKHYYLRTYEVGKAKRRTFNFSEYEKELGLPGSEFKVISIEKSQRTNMFFAAFSFPKVPPFVLHVKIAKEGLSSLNSYLFDMEGFNQINRIASYPISNNDYLLVSGTNTLALLLKSKDKNFILVHKFENLLAGEVTDACIYRNKFISVSPDIPFIVETCASNKVDSSFSQKQLTVEEKKEEIKFDRYDITKLELKGGKFHKIDVSKKGDVIYAIGKGVSAITDLNTAKPQKTDVFYSDKAFSCIKTLKNGNFLVQEAKSNDICEMSPSFKELKRLKGIPGIMLQNDNIKGSRHSHDDAYLPWVKGSNMISLINVKDLSMKEIKNFFGQDTETDVIPIMSICNSDADKMFGTSICKGKMRLSFWEKSSNPRYFNLNDLYPNGRIDSPSRNHLDCRYEPRWINSFYRRIYDLRFHQGPSFDPSSQSQQETVLRDGHQTRGQRQPVYQQSAQIRRQQQVLGIDVQVDLHLRVPKPVVPLPGSDSEYSAWY